MQHMDEGLLQAWLDGPGAGLSDAERAEVEAHLDGCPVCAERVAALRAESARAAELLATASGEWEDEVPDFAAVVQRARELGEEIEDGEEIGEGRQVEEGEEVEDTPGVRPLFGRRTAWAASIAVALGAGWLANEWNTGTPEALLAPLQVTEAPASRADEAGAPRLEDDADVLADRAMEAAPPPGEPEVVEEQARVARESTANLAGRLPSADSAIPATGARSLAEARRAAEAPAPEPQARLAPPAVEPDPVARTRQFAVVPESASIQGRVVDAQTGRAVPNAQVFVPGTSAGVLSDADGRFVLSVAPDADSLLRDLGVSVEVVGYRTEQLAVEPSGGPVRLGDVALQQSAVSLDQLVVTGAAGADRASEEASVEAAVPLDDDRWLRVSLPEAGTFLATPPVTIPELPVVSVDVGVFGSARAVRVVQELEDGSPLTLLQTTAPVLAEAGSRGPGTTVETGSGLIVTGWADLAPDTLRALLDRLGGG